MKMQILIIILCFSFFSSGFAKEPINWERINEEINGLNHLNPLFDLPGELNSTRGFSICIAIEKIQQLTEEFSEEKIDEYKSWKDHLTILLQTEEAFHEYHVKYYQNRIAIYQKEFNQNPDKIFLDEIQNSEYCLTQSLEVIQKIQEWKQFVKQLP